MGCGGGPTRMDCNLSFDLDYNRSFLAAMSSSRSDGVTQFVLLSFRPLFFSFSVFGVCSALFQGCSNGALRVFQGVFSCDEQLKE